MLEWSDVIHARDELGLHVLGRGTETMFKKWRPVRMQKAILRDNMLAIVGRFCQSNFDCR